MGTKGAPEVCAVHISCCLLLDSEGVLILPSKSVSFFSHSLESYSSKGRALTPPCWTRLDSLNVTLVCDQQYITHEVLWLPQAVEQACCCVPDSPLCFLLYCQWLEMLECVSVNLQWNKKCVIALLHLGNLILLSFLHISKHLVDITLGKKY